jgi:hypothetical protein
MVDVLAAGLTPPVVPCVVGGVVGVVLVLIAALIVPRLIEVLTPDLRRAKALARDSGGSLGYYGPIVAGAIVAVGVVIAAAVLGAILAVLTGGI